MVRLDAHLYRAVALQRAGLSGTADLETAYKLNPYDRAVVRYLLMDRVAKLSRMIGSGLKYKPYLSDTRRFATSNRFLFPDDDPWMNRLTEILAR